MPNPFDGRAHWIWSEEGVDRQPSVRHDNYRVRFFRRVFRVPAEGGKLVVHLSADSRYVLWCNGAFVDRGPGRGDINHHFFDTHDLTPLLLPGQVNAIAVMVIYCGDVLATFDTTGAPGNLMTAAPGFVFDGSLVSADGREIEGLYSNEKWKVLTDRGAYRHEHCEGHGTFVGFTERFFGEHYPWGWQQAGFDDSSWPAAWVWRMAVTADTVRDNSMPHRLVPRMIPPMEQRPQGFDRVLEGDTPDAGWQRLIESSRAASGIKRDTLTIPAHTTQRVTLVMNALTTTCPQVAWSGGKGAAIRLTYAEALVKNGKKQRARSGADPRGDVEGVFDELHPGGGEEQWEAWHFRTYRYVRIDVTTADQPLTLTHLSGLFFAYPYELKASFEASDSFLKQLFDVGYWTTRMCSHEVIEDCPYYEQLPYGGDVCVESDLASYLTGDQRLVRQTLHLFDWSRNSDGLTMSRYPCRCPQVIPFWSQFWLMAIYNQYRYDGDVEEVRAHLPTIGTVLDWFTRKREPSETGQAGQGLVGKLNWWCVMDWSLDWGKPEPHYTIDLGVPPGTYHEAGAIPNFFHVWCLRVSAELFDVCGQRSRADEYADQAQALSALAHEAFWDASRGAYTDRRGGPEISQLTNAMAILSGVAPRELWNDLAPKLLDDRFCRAAYFGLHFVFHALHKAGRFDLFYPKLDTWRRMIVEEGMTTIPEDPVSQRSDCHAWSAGPVFHLLAHSLGVRAGEAGFKSLLIAPQPGPLTWLRGSVPTPRGLVSVDLRKDGAKWTLHANVPDGVPTRIHLPGQAEHFAAHGGEIKL